MAAISSYNERDLDATLANMTEDAVFHLGVSGPRGGDYRGKREWRDLLQNVLKLSNESIRLDPIEVLADDTYGVVLFRLTGTRDDKSVDYTVAYAMKFDPAGKQAEAWLLPSDRDAHDFILA